MNKKYRREQNKLPGGFELYVGNDKDGRNSFPLLRLEQMPYAREVYEFKQKLWMLVEFVYE